MNVFNSVLFYFPRLAFRRCALPVLAQTVPADSAERIWRATLKQQQDLALKRPRYSLGANLMLRYMEWDCALYRATQAEGIAASSAKELIEKINWAAFGPMTMTSFQLSRLRSSHLLTRARWVFDLMFLFIFTSPFQRKIHSRPDEVAFDVVVCPLAKYFKDQGVPELTHPAACALDHRMANAWGLLLERSQTIAAGDPLCNFRFRARPVSVERL